MGKDALDTTAWRVAAKTWMVKHNPRTILRPGESVTQFTAQLVSSFGVLHNRQRIQ